MAVAARSLPPGALLCCAALLATACTRVVDGVAATDGSPNVSFPVNVDQILLDQSRMRAITGAGRDLTIIPSMDGKGLVDLDTLADIAPRECRFIFSETTTFGPDVADFHKTTFQYPPKGGLISEGAAAYRDADAARRALDTLVAAVEDCATTDAGQAFVGDWTADEGSLRTRPGGCGRDYRIKSLVLLEVTFCGFPDSVSDIVMTNIAANVPG